MSRSTQEVDRGDPMHQLHSSEQRFWRKTPRMLFKIKSLRNSRRHFTAICFWYERQRRNGIKRKIILLRIRKAALNSLIFQSTRKNIMKVMNARKHEMPPLRKRVRNGEKEDACKLQGAHDEKKTREASSRKETKS